MGFPASDVAKGNLSLVSISEKIGAKCVEESDVNIVFLLNNIAIKKGYEEWINTIQEGIVEIVNEPSTQYQHLPDTTEIVSMIKSFDLANSTPMQSLNFIQQLKMEAQNF